MVFIFFLQDSQTKNKMPWSNNFVKEKKSLTEFVEGDGWMETL